MKYYTASQIAAALRVKRQSVQSSLNVPPDGSCVVAGKLASGWSLGALPLKIQSRLALAVKVGGFRNEDHLLSDPPLKTSPPCPAISEVADSEVQKAIKLRVAMLPVIALRNNRSISAAELEQHGIAEYKRAFGYAISDRHWRRL